MRLDKAIEQIQADVNNEDVDWDSPLGRAYKLSFEALKFKHEWDMGRIFPNNHLLPGETEE